jgi:hypothetical protein
MRILPSLATFASSTLIISTAFLRLTQKCEIAEKHINERQQDQATIEVAYATSQS